MGLIVNAQLTIPESELRESFARAGGPGGQNVNKVSSKAELRWAPATSRALSPEDRLWLLHRLKRRLNASGDLVVTSVATRDQVRNREDARDKLARLLRQALDRPKPRRRSRPTRGAVERRLRSKKLRAGVKRARRAPPDD